MKAPCLPHNGNIMIVDDNPANLKLLEDMLRQHGYEVRSFPRGRLALAAAKQEPPDLVLLDVNMPEMNGYEMCDQLKSSPCLSGIPVIFLSALNAIENKVKGFRSGGVDYISKPFQFEEVLARVETHLTLRRAQQAERDLREKTLGGVVCALVQLTLPVLSRRSGATRDIVRWITQRMEIADPWQYELAATLCLLGCIALPDEVFERGYCGQELSVDEDEMFRAHPERGAGLLSGIPRLEVVADIIRGQQTAEADPGGTDPSRQGAHMLHLALELDRRIYRGIACNYALAELRLSGMFDSRMLDALTRYSPARSESDVRRLPIRELHGGMALDQDVMSKDGNLLILKEGTILTEIWIERLENFSKARGTQELLDVRIPRFAGVRKSVASVEGTTGVAGTEVLKAQ